VRKACAFVFVAFAATSCVSSNSDSPGDLPGCTKIRPSTDNALDCFLLESSKAYLTQIQDKTLEEWAVPEPVDPDQTATLRFGIDRDGSLKCLAVVSGQSEAFVQSIVEAVKRSAPFPPIPRSSICLAQVPISATFSNPQASAAQDGIP